MSESEPEWELLDSDEIEEEQAPSLAAKLFHYFMILLCLGIAFCVGGILFYLFSFRKESAMDETTFVAQQQFIAGGGLAVELIIYWRFKKI